MATFYLGKTRGRILMLLRAQNPSSAGLWDLVRIPLYWRKEKNNSSVLRKLKNMPEILDLSLLKDECVQGKLWKVWRWGWSEDQELNVSILLLRYPLDIFTVLLDRWPHTPRFQDIWDTLLKCVYLQISKECIEIRHFKGERLGLEEENTAIRRADNAAMNSNWKKCLQNAKYD